MNSVANRFVVASLAGLFVGAIAARGQSWPTDVQVFRDVYGQVNADGSVRWDAAKEPKPGSSKVQPFAAAGQAMAVKILLRAEKEGRLYVATSAIPKEPDGEYFCHSCGAALGGAVYKRLNGVWKLQAASPVAIYAGSWGGPPAGTELRRCGEQTYCFVVNDGFTGQGYTDWSTRVYGPVGESMRELLTVEVGLTDPDGTKELSASLRFVPRASRSPFFDAEVMTVRRNCVAGHCSNLRDEVLYRYRDGEYAEVPAVASVVGRPKGKAK